MLVSVVLGSLSSCTKVIDIDVNSSDPQVVVEANLDNQLPGRITLTESVNFDDDNSFPFVEGASIYLTDDLGNSELLSEVSPGCYSGEGLVGNINRTYSLSILTDGKELTSVCTMPDQVNFDTLIVNAVTSGAGAGPGGGFAGGSTHEIIVEYNDPVGVPNFYRFVVYKNGYFINALVVDDRLTDGLKTSTAITGFGSSFASGDTLKVEMQCISREVYDYYRSFGNLFGGPAGASTPANPYTNVNGTKLGYFSAHTNQSMVYIFP